MKTIDKEIKDLEIVRIERPRNDNADRINLYCKSEGVQYIYKKASQVQDENICTHMYVPPQMFKRYGELSRLNFSI